MRGLEEKLGCFICGDVPKQDVVSHQCFFGASFHKSDGYWDSFGIGHFNGQFKSLPVYHIVTG